MTRLVLVAALLFPMNVGLLAWCQGAVVGLRAAPVPWATILIRWNADSTGYRLEQACKPGGSCSPDYAIENFFDCRAGESTWRYRR